MGASGPIGAAFAVACRGGSGLSVPLSPAACANSLVLGAPYADGGLCVPKSDELKSRLDASLGVNGRDGSRSDALHDVLSHVCVLCVVCCGETKRKRYQVQNIRINNKTTTRLPRFLEYVSD